MIILFPITLTIAYLVIIVIVGYSIYMMRRKKGLNDFKSALTPICFLLVPVMNLIVLGMGWPSIISWTAFTILLLLGAYFMKYLPKHEPEQNASEK